MSTIKEIQKADLNFVHSLFERASENQKLQVLRSKDYFAEAYKLLSPEFVLIGVWAEDQLDAMAAFIHLPATSSWLVTDLIKDPSTKEVNATLPLVKFFIDSNKLWDKKFELVFIEEHLNSLEPLIEFASRKYGLECHVSEIHSNAFLVEQVESENLNWERECKFFTDKMFRRFKVQGKEFSRAYVSMKDSTELKDVIKAGKKYSSDHDCNTFILLTKTKQDIGQDFTYLNRFVSVGNGGKGGKEFILKNGILL